MTTSQEGRRRTPRHKDFTSDSLIIETTLEPGTNQALNARLLDVSQGGLGIALRLPLVAGDDVDVDGELNWKCASSYSAAKRASPTVSIKKASRIIGWDWNSTNTGAKPPTAPP